MLMADTMAWFFGILGLMLALPALWLLCRGLWPEMVEDATQDCKRGLFIPFLIGIPISVTAFVAVNFASKAFGPLGGPIAATIVCLYIMYASIGVSGLITTIGQRLPSPADADRPWKATIRGGIVLELAYLLPFLGWFGLLPISLIIGSGCTTRGLIRGCRKKISEWRHKGKTTISTASGDAGLEGAVGA